MRKKVEDISTLSKKILNIGTKNDKLMFYICIVISTFSIMLMSSIYLNGFANIRVVIMQTIASGLGIVLSLIMSYFDYRFLLKLSPIFALISVFAVLSLKIEGVGYTPIGSDDNAWIKIAGLSLQPSEILKLAFVFTFALHLSKVKRKINTFGTFLLLCLHGFIPTFLIFDTGDYGSAIVFIAIFCVMMYVAGLSWRLILVGITVLLGVSPFVWMKLPNYLKTRIKIALHPEIDINGIGYQQYQGKLALKSGGLFGNGLYGNDDNILVPECHNDFIFSYIVQTLGFIGGVITIILLTILMIKILKTAMSSKDDAGKFICVGVFSIILIQTIINIGMILCVVPVIGVTLPFVSYGGTSLVISYMSIGMVLSVCRTDMKKR